MNSTTKLMALAFLASFAAAGTPVSATAADGNYSLTFDFMVATEWDFREGVGVYDPGAGANPCPSTLMLGLRVVQPVSSYYETLRIANNYKGAGVRTSGVDPAVVAPCPVPLAPPQGNMEVWYSGLRWRAAGYDGMSSTLNLCSQLIQSTSGGCIPDPTTVDLRAANCPWSSSVFGHDSTDGKPDFGVWDILGTTVGGTIYSDSFFCTFFTDSHDFSATVTEFSVNTASQGFHIIQNIDIVHPEAGDGYAVICWTLDYVNLDGMDANGDGDTNDPGDTAPGDVASAAAHDWQLILDLGQFGSHIPAVISHLNVNGPAFLQGLYSTAPGVGAGNGSGGCPVPGADHDHQYDLIPLT